MPGLTETSPNFCDNTLCNAKKDEFTSFSGFGRQETPRTLMSSREGLAGLGAASSFIEAPQISDAYRPSPQVNKASARIVVVGGVQIILCI